VPKSEHYAARENAATVFLISPNFDGLEDDVISKKLLNVNFINVERARILIFKTNVSYRYRQLKYLNLLEFNENSTQLIIS
jgi:hypothetical protein